jgi:cytochrome b subunit of formate dehydrogenase
VHVAEATPDQPLLYWVRWIYLMLIFGTIGGMLLHNGIDFAYRLGGSWRAHLGRAVTHTSTAVERWYVRMTLGERIQHALLAASFFVLVFTGMALKFPETWMFAWFARLEHGYALRSITHRWAAVVLVGVSLFHVGYLFTRRGRGMVRAMVPGIRDVFEVRDNLLHLLGRRKDPPKFDRFSYIEKAEYWALIWGTVVMSATGFILWFEAESLRAFGMLVTDLATLVHYYEAWLAFLAILVWHGYHTVLRPDVYPMSWSWITGRMTEEEMKHEHGGEWERMEAEKREAREATDAARPVSGTARKPRRRSGDGPGAGPDPEPG